MQHISKHILIIGGMLLLVTDLAMAAPKFTPQSQPTGWLSRPPVTDFDLASGTENFFQLSFFKDTWSGDVLAFDINNFARVLTTGPWDEANPTLTTAASLLDARNPADRKIVINDPTIGTHAFRWASLTSDEQNKIGSEDMLNFVRGDRSNEEPSGLSWRPRESVVGDILHSNIIYWDNGTSQSLFVGANDGMLHALDANTGVENFAFIPSMMKTTLKDLAKKPYVHKHFVDGPIAIANILISNASKSILVGGLGAGGIGLYALDVTTQTAADESAAAAKFMWEIDGRVDPYKDYIGYVYGTPVFTRLSDGTAAVIVGNGYVSNKGQAILYVINADTGALISAISTGPGDGKNPNGLSSPTLYDADGDSVAEYAYAGDIDGHLWKFDLSNNTASLLYTTSPVQAITTAPAVHAHPNNGQMVTFATGRMLSSGDKTDTSVHYVYGIWDGAPDENNQLLSQTLVDTTFDGIPVRTTTNNVPVWSAGSGNHKGWRVALLAPGERVVGEKPFYNNGRFYFLSTNPTVDGGENWLHELVFNTGGSPLGPIFDLNEDHEFDAGDLALNGDVPVAKYLGPGIMSQPTLVDAEGLTTTLFVFHPDLPIEGGVPVVPADPGVSAGHFDFDIYYYGSPSTQLVSSPTLDYAQTTICKKTSDVEKKLDSVDNLCKDDPVLKLLVPGGYTYLTDYNTGAICKPNDDIAKVEYYQLLTCNTVLVTEVTSASYVKVKHVHEYDDKYNVTGVNMLNASDPGFNLINALPDGTTPFKILVMNQYLNPAAFLSVGGADYESVQTYGQLASQTDPAALLIAQPVYTRNDVGTLIYNLPLDAFKNKDWWGDGAPIRSGLIPTQTGCVNGVNADGSVKTPGLLGERFNGAFTIQLIKPDTPASSLELNGPNVTYGWRVKLADFTTYVLAEYTSFWHHPNGACYGDADWVQDAPEDFGAAATSGPGVVGSADPTGGAFGSGISVVSEITTTSVDGTVVTTVTTYSDDSEYIKIDTRNADGTTTTWQQFRDGSESTTSTYSGRGGKAGFIDPNTGSPEEDLSTGKKGRQSWRDLID